MRIDPLAIFDLYASKKRTMRAWKRDHEEQAADGRVVGEWESRAQKWEELLRAKRRALAATFLWVLLLVSAGAVCAIAANHWLDASWNTVRLVRAAALVLVAWAVMGRLDDFQSMGGVTYLERVNDANYRTLYSLGVFLGGFALFLDGSGGV